MRNFKKFLALVLATLMVFSVAVISTSAEDVLVAANTSSEYTEAAQHLAALKIMKGDGNNLMLDSGVTRYQAALFFVQALTGETDAAAWNADKSVYFTDVPEYGTAIDYAYDLGIILGRGDGTYGYNDPITYQDLLVMAVRALGYETANMSYPTGYTTAARTLGLTKNIAIGVGKTSPLKRGETAQIIWDMLNTDIAITDSLSGKILYPGQKDLLLEATGIGTTRTQLLANFSDATLDAVITAVDTSKKTATIAYGTETATVKLADLGLTVDTAKINYLGLPVKLFVDCEADEFAAKYADGKASIVFANYPSYTTVENLSSTASTIKVAADSLTLNGTKFDATNVTVKVFGNAGWEEVDFADFKAEYTANTFAKISYLVTDGKVEALYTPYAFAQYQVFTTKDATTAKDADFAAYSADFGATYKLFGSNAIIKATTSSVSNKNGSAAKTLTVAGEAVKSGDFFYGAYNTVDNVLTVALNCGTFQTGRLTSVASDAKTVKISGTTYTLATAGSVEEITNTYIGKLEAGKDNVKFLVVNNKIVKMDPVSVSSSTSSNYYDFAIISTDEATVAKVLDLTEAQYNAALKAGLYVTDKGVAVAVMSKTTGKWEVGYVSGVASDYNKANDVFATTTDLASMASFKDMGLTLDPAKEAAFTAAVDVLNVTDHIVAVVSEKDGAMVVAEKVQGLDKIVASGRGENGVTLTSSAKITSYISANDEVEAQRITYTSNTLFIAIDADGYIASRTGTYSDLSKSNTYIGKPATFYAANSDLFVFVQDTANAANLLIWSGYTDVVTTANYFMVMPGTTYAVEETAEGDSVLVIKNLFDLKTLKAAADQTLDYTTANLALLTNVGTILSRDAKNNFTKLGDYNKLGNTLAIYKAINETIKTSMNLADNKALHGGASDGNAICFDHFVMNGEFIGFRGVEAANATKLVAQVITLDLTGINTAKYDYSNGYLKDVDYVDGLYDYALEADNGKFAYSIDGDVVERVTEETDGVLNQFIVDTIGETVVIPALDGKSEKVVKVEFFGAKTEASGVATAIIFKVITNN